MNNSKKALASQKGTSKLVKARFGPGMLLQHEDLEQLNTYTQELSRLLFRSFFGHGVVCGLQVKATTVGRLVHIVVSPGLAMACSGEPISVPTEQTIKVGDDCSQDIPTKLWVVLCGTSISCAPRNSMCSDDETQADCTRLRKGFELCVVAEWPDWACGCAQPKDGEPTAVPNECACVDPKHACYKDHYAGICDCNDDTGSTCDCECVLLGALKYVTDKDNKSDWQTDYRVRRFIRPVLMQDPASLPKPSETPPPAGNKASKPTQDLTPNPDSVEELAVAPDDVDANASDSNLDEAKEEGTEVVDGDEPSADRILELRKLLDKAKVERDKAAEKLSNFEKKNKDLTKQLKDMGKEKDKAQKEISKLQQELERLKPDGAAANDNGNSADPPPADPPPA